MIREVTGSPDANELIGRVKSTQYLEELGAELMEGSMILGDNAYASSPGSWPRPSAGSTSSSRRRSTSRSEADEPSEPRTDEELLKQFIKAYS